MEKKTRRQKNTEYQQVYRAKHPERIIQSNKAYYEKHKSAIARRQKANRENKTPSTMAEILKEHRRSLGMSQQKYAEVLGITQATLSMWERGLVPVNLETVATVFPELAKSMRKEIENV